MNQARAEPKNERMRETMKQQLLELISENNNGIRVAEAMSITGLDYTGILAAVTDLCRNSSLAWILLKCTSIVGRATAFIASSKATL